MNRDKLLFGDMILGYHRNFRCLISVGYCSYLYRGLESWIDVNTSFTSDSI